jgi:hypothetical protein
VKRVGKLCICLAGGLVLNAGLRAADTVSPDHPYAPIVTRNVFNIHPPPPVDPNKQPDVPLPKITPNGIMSVFGHLQALFKVAIPPKQGQPAREQTYMLSEGQQQDDIEVTKIDEQAGMVTFNNHGTVQELPLTVATASGSSAPAQGGPGPGSRPGLPMSGIAPGGGSGGNAGGFVRFGNRFGQSGGFGGQNPNINAANTANNGSMNGGASQGSRLGVALAGGSGYSSPQPVTQPQVALSADEQAVVITANHAIAVAQGDPTAPIFPSTDYDKDAGVTPNVAPPPSPGGSTSQ